MMDKASFLDNILLGWGQCVTVWQSSKSCYVSLAILLKHKAGVRNAIYGCPTTSRGWEGITHLMSVADICCFIWQLPKCNCPFTDSRKTERKCDTGRNNEAWVQSPQEAFGFSVTNMSLDDNIIIHLTHVVGVCCLMGWMKVWRTSGAQHKWQRKRSCSMHFTGFALCFL